MTSQSGTNSTPAPRLTIYFDGACPVCRREIGYYQQQAGADTCAWIDASRCSDAELGTDLSRAAALARLHVRRPDGQLIDGARGFAALWRALPRTAWLGRIAEFGPFPVLLEFVYQIFIFVRRAWRPAAALNEYLPDSVLADLRSDHAGEVGAVQIYLGILAVTRNEDLRAFATRHLVAEQRHLGIIARYLPSKDQSNLLFVWRTAGWLTGALPAIAGPGAVYATIAAVERFVDTHYTAQITALDILPRDERLSRLRADLEQCRLDEVHHLDDAINAMPAEGLVVRMWTRLVSSGSSIAVSVSRHF